MKYIVGTIGLASLLALSIPASAQVATPNPVEYTLRVTIDEINILSDGLQTQPFGKVAPLVNKLQTQIKDQQKLSAPTPAPAPATPKE